MMRCGRRDERGAASLEVVLLVPALVLIMAVLMAGWRLGSARSNVVAATASGARAASIQPSGSRALIRADEVVRGDLATTGVDCANLAITTDVTQFARQPGVSASVSVQVSCDVDLADLLVPGLPGSVHIASSATERLDTYRERKP